MPQQVRETVTPRVKFPPFGWELSGGGGGGQGQPGEVMLQNLTLPQVRRPEGAAFQELRPGAGPMLGTVPQTPSSRPPGAWAVALSLAPSPSPLPPLLYCWLEGQGRVKTSVAGFCLSLGERGVQTGPDVVGLWAAEAASLGGGCGGGARGGGRGQAWGGGGAHFLEAGSSVLRGV